MFKLLLHSSCSVKFFLIQWVLHECLIETFRTKWKCLSSAESCFATSDLNILAFRWMQDMKMFRKNKAECFRAWIDRWQSWWASINSTLSEVSEFENYILTSSQRAFTVDVISHIHDLFARKTLQSFTKQIFSDKPRKLFSLSRWSSPCVNHLIVDQIST